MNQTVPIRCRFVVPLMSLLLTISIWGAPIHSAAQELETTTGLLDLSSLNGVQHAGARSYAMDISQIVQAISEDNIQPPEPDGPMLMLLLVAQFASPEQASDSVETIQDHYVDEMNADSIGFEIAATEIEDPGDTAVQITGIGADQQTEVDGYIVQDNDWLYLAIAIGTNGTSDSAATDLITFTLEHESGSEDIQYDHTGASTGGLWDKLPGADDEDAISGTVPVFDNYLLPPEGDVPTL